ncbi:hypothetical protein FQA39_LY19075 [Lamprigera yunnana]|nr:hypothetical protein FQA39_LY19075 [Lamprigera yunnana]
MDTVGTVEMALELALKTRLSLQSTNIIRLKNGHQFLQSQPEVSSVFALSTDIQWLKTVNLLDTAEGLKADNTYKDPLPSLVGYADGIPRLIGTQIMIYSWICIIHPVMSFDLKSGYNILIMGWARNEADIQIPEDRYTDDKGNLQPKESISLQRKVIDLLKSELRKDRSDKSDFKN